MVEIGCIDINTMVSQLSSDLAMSRHEHLETVLHVMGYLMLRNNSRLSLDQSCPDIEDFYEGAVEVILPNSPPPGGRGVYV